jgi:hypothetical protein
VNSGSICRQGVSQDKTFPLSENVFVSPGPPHVRRAQGPSLWEALSWEQVSAIHTIHVEGFFRVISKVGTGMEARSLKILDPFLGG